MSHDDLCKLVNDTYRDNTDFRIRIPADDPGIPFDVVWECLWFKDYSGFVETGEIGMEEFIGLLILG